MENGALDLFDALKDEDNNIVNELINRHGDFNKVLDKYGQTALHLAAKSTPIPYLKMAFGLHPLLKLPVLNL